MFADQPNTRGQIDRGLIVLFATWAITRIAMTLLLTVDSEVQGAGDVWRYNAVADALLHGTGDHRVRIWEYPLGSLGVILPPLMLGARDASDYLVAFVTFAVAFDFLALLGVLLTAPRGRYNRSGAALWIAGPLALGLVSLTRLDIVACAAAAIGTAMTVRYRRDALAAAVLSAGALVKVWPGLIFLGVIAWSTQRRRALSVALLPVLFLIVVTTLFKWWYLAFPFLSYQRDRGLQIESFAALPMLWLDKFNVLDYGREFRFGAQQITGPGTHLITAMLSVLMVVLLCGLALALRSHRARQLTTQDRLLLTAALVVSCLIVTSKVFSGQYMLWLLLVVAMTLGSGRVADLHAAALVLSAAVLTHAIYPALYPNLVDRQVLPLTILTLRDGLVLFAIWRLSSPLRPSRPNRPESPAGASSV